jgi:hypothetical protein
MNTLGKSVLSFAFGTLLLGLSPDRALARGSLDPEAAATVREVDRAAQRRNFRKLRSLMANEFTYDFGGAPSPDEAIEEWRGDRKYLRALVRVLRRGCHATDAETIDCPGKGDTTFRAGFKREGPGWRLKYFVQGD